MNEKLLIRMHEVTVQDAWSYCAAVTANTSGLIHQHRHSLCTSSFKPERRTEI